MGVFYRPIKCTVDNHTTRMNAKGKRFADRLPLLPKNQIWFITDTFYHNWSTLCDNNVVECQELI